MTTTAATHRVRWFVYTGHRTADGHAERIPRTASMRGHWPAGYDAECACGWKTRTGGAVRSYIELEIWQHKRDCVTEDSRRSA